MKKLLTLALALFATYSLSAQSNPYISLEGYQSGEDGATYLLPGSEIAIDIVVEKQSVVAGPYARYALKNLGIRVPFTDKVSYRLVEAKLALNTPDSYYASGIDSYDSHRKSHLDAISVERTNILQPSDEDAALEAAQQIFALRRSRLDLITGEAGEHVFGEGLKVALKAIDRREQALLELFMGRVETSRECKRFILRPSGEKNQYIICRFSSEEGLLDSSNLSGDIILLYITAGDVPQVTEASEKSRTFVRCRLAAQSLCQLLYGDELLGSAQLPLFEYGKSVNLEK